MVPHARTLQMSQASHAKPAPQNTSKAGNFGLKSSHRTWEMKQAATAAALSRFSIFTNQKMNKDAFLGGKSKQYQIKHHHQMYFESLQLHSSLSCSLLSKTEARLALLSHLYQIYS